jgi:aerobic carbon-monoxide dehydrogenase medium subunit
MYPSPIDRYFRPSDLAEALRLRVAYPDECWILAGGQSLVPLMKAREVAPKTLIDLNRVPDLDRIECGLDVIRIGALVRQRALERHPELRELAQGLTEAAGAIGDLQVRNRGTVVGSLCHGDPTGDIAPPAIALGAHLRIAGGVGEVRLVPLTGLGPTLIASAELATHVEFRRPPTGSVGAYLKVGRVAQDRAIVSVATQIEFDSQGVCQHAVIVVGGVVPGPRLAIDAALRLRGERIDHTSATAAAKRATDDIEAQADGMASAAYRQALIGVTVERVLLQAAARHRGAAR